MTTQTSSERRGRRPGSPDTRGAILEAARDAFAAKGFRSATVRGVAAAAGVDAALVHHYFGSKHQLFLAAMQVPLDPRRIVAGVLEAGPDAAGERLLDAVLSVWDEPTQRAPLLALVRSSLGDEDSGLLREGLTNLVLPAVETLAPGDDARVRACLAATQVLGVLVARYVLRLEPLAGLPRQAVVAAVGPSVQRYLTGSLAR